MILIIAKPGRLRDALCTLLKSISQQEVISQADDGLTGLKMIVEHNPTLVLLDASLPDNEVRVMVEQIKAQQPQTRCLVLANTLAQQEMAKQAGADGVVLKGFPGTNLFKLIDQLMARPKG